MSGPDTVPPVAAALVALGVPHRVFRHPGPVSTLEVMRPSQSTFTRLQSFTGRPGNAATMMAGSGYARSRTTSNPSPRALATSRRSLAQVAMLPGIRLTTRGVKAAETMRRRHV